MGARRGLSATLLALVCGAPLVAQEAARVDSAVDSYPVLATYGHLSRGGEHQELLSLEVVEVRPEGYGARFSVGTWLHTGVSGIIETEVGVAGAAPVISRLHVTASAGPMFSIGGGIVWGLYGNIGALVEPAGPIVLHAAAGRRWYRVEGAFVQFATWTVGAGIRLGPYARTGGRDPARAVH